ncbi:hypothetical protein HOLleu_36901 [Holothuria leucospilota]|uniref:exodeoxyribonuclease III n=1 Tax=Holothuria leucospilota TaxID=206669 RepID=A0A9Q1BDX7_HOLLE|nr:hypothetical protein HOLleu_36901 [Holothuria leucospilota]
MSNLDNIKFCTQNVRGLRNYPKRRELFAFFHRQSYDIIFIQESHSLPDDESRWNNEWGRQIVFSHGSNSSRGVAVLFKPTFSCNCTKSFSDTGGRYVILNLTYCDIILTIVNVYGPNIDDPNFYDILSSNLQCFTCTM